MLLNGSFIATMAEWHAFFSPTSIGNFEGRHYSSAIGCNGVSIWLNFGLPPSTIDNTDSALQNKTKYLSETQTQPT